MNILITLTNPGFSVGPTFSLFSNVDGFTNSFETGITKAALVAGYYTSIAPFGTTIVRVKSLGPTCDNYVDLPVVLYPTTTTTTTEDPGAYWNAQWCTGMGTPPILRVPSSAVSGQVIYGGDTLDSCATLTTPYIGTPPSYIDRRTYSLYSNCIACNELVNHRWATMVRCDNPSIIAYSNWFNVGDFNVNDIVTEDPTFSPPPYYIYRITSISTNSSNFPQFVIQATGLSSCPTTTTTTTTAAPTTSTTTTLAPTTTTTTTIAPTTTTTTTIAPAQCYKLAYAPNGGCQFVFKNAAGQTITTNIPPQDEGLCFIECVSEVISDTCNFTNLFTTCDAPQCSCIEPPITTTTTTTLIPITTTTTTTLAPTTTTTTTIAPTTTTTTTLAPGQCYKLAYAPNGGCQFVFKNEAGQTITTNIPPQDEGLCFIECVSEVISDTCNFTNQQIPCDAPGCSCTEPPVTTTTTTTATPPPATTTTTTTLAPATTTTTTTGDPLLGYCYKILVNQSSGGECFECQGTFPSTTDWILQFYENCNGSTLVPPSTILPPYDTTVVSYYDNNTSETINISAGETDALLIASRVVSCGSPPSCSEESGPTFLYATVTPVTGTVGVCCT
jgi:hypothetical protein